MTATISLPTPSSSTSFAVNVASRFEPSPGSSSEKKGLPRSSRVNSTSASARPVKLERPPGSSRPPRVKVASALSIEIRDAGVKTVASSFPAARTLVSFFGLTALTFMLGRLSSWNGQRPTISRPFLFKLTCSLITSTMSLAC